MDAAGTLLAVMAALLSLTVNEWIGIFVAIIGTGGLSAFGGGIVSLRRLRIDERVSATEQSVQERTVSMKEAELAVSVLGAEAARQRDELAATRKALDDLRREGTEKMVELQTKVAHCEKECTELRVHAESCPIWKQGRSPA